MATLKAPVPAQPLARLVQELRGLLAALAERALRTAATPPAGEAPVVARERPNANVARPVRRLTRPEGETTTRER